MCVHVGPRKEIQLLHVWLQYRHLPCLESNVCYLLQDEDDDYIFDDDVVTAAAASRVRDPVNNSQSCPAKNDFSPFCQDTLSERPHPVVASQTRQESYFFMKLKTLLSQISRSLRIMITPSPVKMFRIALCTNEILLTEWIYLPLSNTEG